MYEYTADPPGTFWYHSHSGVQIADGVMGSLIVQVNERPRRSSSPVVPSTALLSRL